MFRVDIIPPRIYPVNPASNADKRFLAGVSYIPSLTPLLIALAGIVAQTTAQHTLCQYN